VAVRFGSSSRVKARLPRYSNFWDGTTVYAPNSYESIATVIVGSGGQSSITFNSIPSTYSHLQLRLFLRGDYAGANFNDNILLRFNSDSGSNYTRHILFIQDTSSPSSYGAASTSAAYAGASPNASTGISNTFSGGVTDILDYANTGKYKTVRTLQGYDTNGGGKQRLSFESSVWMNTSAINSISIISDNSDNWVQYSSFALYGIK
jgi:hypothetical protein